MAGSSPPSNASPSPDLVTSVTNGKLRYALGDLAALPRAAVVVEDRYSALFKQRYARPPPSGLYYEPGDAKGLAGVANDVIASVGLPTNPGPRPPPSSGLW